MGTELGQKSAICVTVYFMRFTCKPLIVQVIKNSGRWDYVCFELSLDYTIIRQTDLT